MTTTRTTEHADVVIVGTRCAGTAAAVVFARAGKRVIGLDKARFPSGTMTTHAMVPNAVQELARMGALEKVLALGPAMPTHLTFHDTEVHVRERFRPFGGIDYGLCIPREQLDVLLVEAARDAGADMRERCMVDEVLWRDGRACGVRYRSGGEVHEIRCKLVIGADGRKSKIAAEVGSWQPYRGSKNGRGFAYRYMDDPQGAENQDSYDIYRANGNQTLVLPSSPAGRIIVVHMCDAADIPKFRSDGEAAWQEKLDQAPRLKERLLGATNADQIRTTDDLTSFYRRSSGPGWALAGDAGHFKDPTTGNGMRDALRHGRILAEYAAPVLDSDSELDHALRTWERQRDLDTMSTYHWGNRETRPGPTTQLVRSVLGTFAGEKEPGLSDIFNRTTKVESILGPPRLLKGALRAWRTRGVDRTAILRELRQELPLEIELRRSRFFYSFRSERVWATEHPDWSIGEPPAPKTSSTLERNTASRSPAHV